MLKAKKLNITGGVIIPKGRVLKSLTLPESVADNIESLAKKTELKQADIIKVATFELLELNDDELDAKLRKHNMY